MFSFKGVKDIDMGINALPYTRTLHPAQRVQQTYIQGRDGTYDWSDDTFDNLKIAIPCVYFGSQAPETLRQVAAWLRGTGQLVFDDEPERYYQASLYESVDLSRALFEDSFTLTFVAFPFQLSFPKAAAGVLPNSGGKLNIVSDGTAKTPCTITITNTGTDIINSITIAHNSLT